MGVSSATPGTSLPGTCNLTLRPATPTLREATAVAAATPLNTANAVSILRWHFSSVGIIGRRCALRWISGRENPFIRLNLREML